ncbi:hypothetical protein Poli38472_006039 [Pythium oligandrum]|uniref:Mediator of RNA polymerase II transcription subunit 17 n=1 Tax=Pythium oligandrum TaxID=41045 RepID=A0A8K1CRN9_PYTOL|nr:hypothetical protein Poli38472_006039 [Pythium oligandrum]|eukprot:TMW68571.1 hypothetical protein Poli38472_006039 [Pythium oligandrum]
MSLDASDSDPVAVTLFPVEYATVEMITAEGEEILEQDFSEAQLFMHSIQELEKVRTERTKNKKRRVMADENGKQSEKSESDAVVKAENDDTDEVMMDVTDDAESIVQNGETKEEAVEEEEEEDHGLGEEVIDPRIHYRPMVQELQASIVELNQLINTIDLIRKRDFLEDMQCIRENTTEKKEDLSYLIESKADQLKDSSQVLLAGVEALTKTVVKESNFFEGVTQMIHKWKICAPIHGNIPKPFRAGEPLAVDCSFVSAGSRFAPPTRSIADLSFAELSRTDKGLVCIKTPEEYLSRTVTIKLRSMDTGTTGSYTLQSPEVSNLSQAVLDRLENTPEDLKILDERNASVLRAVQFSVFCEELFYTVMQEALWSSNSWTDSALSEKKRVTKKPSRAEESGLLGTKNVSVLEVLDDEVCLRLRDRYELTVKLLDATSDAVKSNHESVSNGHTDAPHNVPNGVEMTNGSARQNHLPLSEENFLNETCRYAMILLQQEIRSRHGRNEMARGLLFSGVGTTPGTGSQSNQLPHSGDEKVDNTGTLAAVVAVISHNLLKQEVTDYLDHLSAKLAFQNLQVSATGRILEDGLNQPTCDSVREILISGTRIRFEDGPGTVREVSTLPGLKQFIEKTICSQVALALHRDLISYGLKQATLDLDNATVRLFAAGEWDGRCIGDGRVPDTKSVSCIFLEPYITTNTTVAISCVLQSISLLNVQSLARPCQTRKGDDLHEIEWSRIPGNSDVAKIVWMLQRTTGLPDYFEVSAQETTATS